MAIHFCTTPYCPMHAPSPFDITGRVFNSTTNYYPVQEQPLPEPTETAYDLAKKEYLAVVAKHRALDDRCRVLATELGGLERERDKAYWDARAAEKVFLKEVVEAEVPSSCS